jgi:hypothetical protein
MTKEFSDADSHSALPDADPPPDAAKLELTQPELDLTDKEAQAEDVDQPTEPSAEQLVHDRELDGKPVQPDADLELEATGARVYWPSDDLNAPDYSHLVPQSVPSEFSLTPNDLELLIAVNRFQPHGLNDVICIAFRGAVLLNPHEVERQTSIDLRDVRPDHQNFRCTIGFYYRADRKITLFTGSTVPAPHYMREYHYHQNGISHSAHKHYLDGTNLLPTGCYVARVDRHSNIRPALRMAEPHDLTEDAHATVLRTTNDLAFDTQDTWDPSRPHDNVHCSYVLNYSSSFGAHFSSAGCLTVRGRKDPSHQWKKYQAVLNALGRGKRCDLLVLTGKDAAIAAKLRSDGVGPEDPDVLTALGRLRTGSHGEEVTRMQQKLGFSGSGYFGYLTKDKLASHQRDNNIASDGIYSPKLDEALGWNVFERSAPGSTSPPSA